MLTITLYNGITETEIYKETQKNEEAVLQPPFVLGETIKQQMIAQFGDEHNMDECFVVCEAESENMSFILTVLLGTPEGIAEAAENCKE